MTSWHYFAIKIYFKIQWGSLNVRSECYHLQSSSHGLQDLRFQQNFLLELSPRMFLKIMKCTFRKHEICLYTVQTVCAVLVLSVFNFLNTYTF